MFAATRVMAAGKAGLESLPMFVDECVVQGIPLLAPWAADHNDEDIKNLRDSTRQRRNTTWKDVAYIGDGEIGLAIEQNASPSQRLVHHINPAAAEQTMIPDNPAQLAAWCRLRLSEHCRDTIDLWERFKYDKGISGNQQLAVIIPYCPEGPTSGTVGMYLGAALRKYFKLKGLKDELVVWGIELCPPILDKGTDVPDQMGSQHAFRGYVARQELLGGLPLSDDPEDDDYWDPFDINIAVDGVPKAQLHTNEEEVCWAIDRAAAQITASLINGAAADDVAESTLTLMTGKRWNASLTHVVSQRNYEAHSRYMLYHRNLPWNRAPELWDTADIKERCEAFLRRADEISEWLKDEPIPEVREHVEKLLSRANELREIKDEVKCFVFRDQREANLKRRTHLESAKSEDEASVILLLYNEPPNIIAKRDPLCINIQLPISLRQQAADKAREETEISLTDLLGDAGTYQVRDQISKMLTGLLSRSDCDSVNINSQARFESMIVISIENNAVGRNNGALSPYRDFFQDFIDPKSRGVPGSLNLRSFDINKYIVSTSIMGSSRPYRKKVLGWQPPKDVNFDIPVEFSLLTLARCNPQDGFSDISTHDEMKEHYHTLVKDNKHREFARYYTTRVPEELKRPETR